MTPLRLACLLAGLLLHVAARSAAQTEIYGSGCSGALAAPSIAVSGSILPGAKAQVSLAGAPPGAITLFLLGTSDTSSVYGPLPLDLSAFPEFAPGCELLGSSGIQILLTAGAQGTLKLSFKLPSTLGSDLYAQWAVVESVSPLSVVMTAGAHISLQTNPDVHAEIVAPATVVDWDGDGTEPVSLDGSASHTHEAGHEIITWKWKLDGEPAGTAAVIEPVVAAGAHVATLLVGDDNVPPDTALASHAFSVVPPGSAPGVLARYYGSGAADPKNLLDAEPLAADFAEVLPEALVSASSGFVGGSPFGGQCMVTLDCNVTLPVADTFTFTTVGGSEALLYVDGALTPGPLALSAGGHVLEARYAVPDTSVLPLTLLVAQGGGPATPLDGASLDYDATASGPVINALTPPDGSSAGGNVVVIDGTGFFPAAATQLEWGDLTLTTADGLDIQPAQITLTTPPHAAGPLLVRVHTPAGASNAGSFTYVDGGPATVNFALVTTVALPGPTSAEWGPDGRLYVGTLTGEIKALSFDDVWNVQAIDSYVGVSQLPNRNILGLTVSPFDPPGTVSVLVGHGWHYADGGALVTQPSTYWGQVSRLTGPAFDAPVPVVTNLPQPNTGHAVNGLQLDHNGDLLIAMGSTSNAGIKYVTMGDLPESPLSAAILEARTSLPGFSGAVGYLDAVTGLPSTDQRFGEQALLAPGSQVLVQGAGLRNPYDLVYTTRRKLYATDNGPNAGYGPASTGPATQTPTDPDHPDELLLVEAGNYYGSPNRARGLFDARQHVYHDPWGPSQPDTFTQTLVVLPSSQDGLVEYRSDTFDGSLRGELLAQKYLGEARRVALAADGRGVASVSTVLPATGALDLVTGPGGALIGIDFTGNQVDVLVPVEAPSAALVVQDIQPWRAPAAGGQTFVIGGRGFSGAVGDTSVFIGGLAAQVTQVTPTRIRGVLPAQPAPTTELLDVAVVSGPQSDTLPDAFRWLFAPGNEPGTWELGGLLGAGALPVALSETTAAVLDGRLYVAGAESAVVYTLDLVGSSVPPLAWAQTAPRPFAGGANSAEVVDGKLYLVGGLGAAAGRVQIFDPVTGLWSTGASMPWAGASVSTAVIGGRIYAAGGIVGAATVDNLAVYDPGTNLWTPLPAMPLHAGRNHAASGTDGQRLWIFGGYGFGNGPAGQLAPGFDTVQCYDPSSGTWTSSALGQWPPLPVARAGMGRAVWWQDEFYVFGGESSLLLPGAGVSARVDVFDPAAGTWRLESSLPTPRHGQGAAIFQGRVFVAGGGASSATEAGGVVESFTRQ